MLKDGIESFMWRTVDVWENWLLDDIHSLIIVYSIYPIFLNSEPSPLELLINLITSIMLMMLIWLVRMSVTNDWKTCLHLNPYLLEAIHLVVVIQFDLRVMIEWMSNNQIYFHLNQCLLPVIHSDIVIQFNLRIMIEWRSNNQIYQDFNPCIFIKEHLKEMEEMIVNRIAQLLSIIETL